MTTLEDKSIWETTPEEEVLGADILKANTEEIINRTRLLDNDIKVRKRNLLLPVVLVLKSSLNVALI